MPLSKSHLVLRSSTYHCRLDIPAELRPAYGNRRILSRSLKTGDKRLASELAAVQIGQWKAAFRALREQKLRDGDKWKDDLAVAAQDHLAQADAKILAAVRGTLIPSDRPTPTIESVEKAGQRLHQDMVELFTAMYGWEKELGLPGLVDEVSALLDDQDMPTASRIQQYSLIQQRVLAHRAKVQNLLPAAELVTALEIAANPSSYKPKSPISSTAVDKFATYFAEQNDNTRTRGVYLSNIERFSTWLTTHGKELTFDSVAEYLDSVSKVSQTRKGHLAALRSFHKWAIRYEPYYREVMGEKRSPFDGHDHPKVGENAGGSWIAYTQQEAEKLHAAAASKDDTDLADLIAFACYTGCRIEELGRIRKDTTIFDDTGNPIGFRVDDSKTPAGIREIPLHPALQPIYASRLQSPQGTGNFLFPGNDKTKGGLRLNALSQRFTKLKRGEGFGSKHVFHSFRKCTATLLQQAGVPPLTIPFILGHDVGNITFDVYSAGPTFVQKMEAIRALPFTFQSRP